MDRTRSISSASAVSLRRASHENETVIDRFYRILDDSFEISARGTSISLEVFCGYIQFISSMYVLPVVPAQLKAAGYIRTPTIEATALSCAFGCLLSSYITNLPFAIAPPTSVSIYLAVALQQGGLQRYHGDTAVILSGFALVIIGVIKPITTFVSRLIPDCIQASTAVGIGLITAFAGLIELELVVPGRFTILELGSITPSIIIAICSSALIATAMHFHVKGSFVSGLVFGTFVWWLYSNSWPEKIWQMPDFDFDIDVSVDLSVLALLCNLVFLYILALNGIARSMSGKSNKL